MKKSFKNIAAVSLAAVLVLSPVISSGINAAKSDDDAALEKLRQLEIVEGYENSELYPDNFITRAEFTKYLYNAFPDTPHHDVYYEFSDVPEDHWAQEYIQFAVNSDWLKGYDDNSFKPDKNITYEEALTVVCRALGVGGSYYTYPEDYIASSIEYSVTDGIDALIGENITREDAAKMILNALEYIESMKREDVDTDGSVLFNAAVTGASGGSTTVNRSATKAAADSVFFDYEEESWDLDYSIVEGFNTEEYTQEDENVFKNVSVSPLSTFSIDTDTASYSNLRRFILNGQNIPNGSVRTEELINYFDYTKAETEEGKPFGVNYTVSDCPWNDENKLAMITVTGEEMTEYKPSNLVFLIDTSGSMYSYNKLPLVKQALAMLLENLGERDMISIVTYASGTRVALEPTPATEKDKIMGTINSLQAYGSTAGASGINLAYEQAEKFKLDDGNNRIILCTDGDFNVGISSTGDLEKLITEKRESGIFLSVLGFGMGNYKDNKMETLADKGNGNYAYIDNLKEAKKVLVDDMSKTIYTIAKDVKIQVEFNPETVSQYRLIGYENRVLNTEDFENDKKDAGELGAGATVTVLYEIVPATGGESTSSLKYQTSTTTGSDDLMTVKIRHKEPQGTESILSEYPVENRLNEALTADFKFAAAVAELGMILNESEYMGNSTYGSVIELAREGMGDDKFGLRCEFVQLVDLLRYTQKGEKDG